MTKPLNNHQEKKEEEIRPFFAHISVVNIFPWTLSGTLCRPEKPLEQHYQREGTSSFKTKCDNSEKHKDSIKQAKRESREVFRGLENGYLKI